MLEDHDGIPELIAGIERRAVDFDIPAERIPVFTLCVATSLLAKHFRMFDSVPAELQFLLVNRLRTIEDDVPGVDEVISIHEFAEKFRNFIIFTDDEVARKNEVDLSIAHRLLLGRVIRNTNTLYLIQPRVRELGDKYNIDIKQLLKDAKVEKISPMSGTGITLQQQRCYILQANALVEL
jgi:hypothetical protein